MQAETTSLARTTFLRGGIQYSQQETGMYGKIRNTIFLLPLVGDMDVKSGSMMVLVGGGAKSAKNT